MNYSIKILGLALFIMNFSFSQEIIPLWDDYKPNHIETNKVETHVKDGIIRISNVQNPTLEVFLPKNSSSNTKSVIICPGGGYNILSYDWEGTTIAKKFVENGIAAFVLKYRLPKANNSQDKHKAALSDALRAIRIIRKNADKWNINKNKIGIIGFSAGGHVASTLGTHYNETDSNLNTKLDSINARPDFMALIYPVITMNNKYTHQGSKNNLLGKNPPEELIQFYSNELYVTEKTPPTFLVHSGDDKGVPVMNSIRFYEALQEKNIKAEMHIYPEGGHGYSLAIGQGRLSNWFNQLIDWIESLD